MFNTSYIDSRILGGKLIKNFFKARLQAEISYRNIYYHYTKSENIIKQNAYGFNINWQINKSMYMSIDFEQTKDAQNTDNRYFVTLTKRFKSARKPIKKK